MEDSAFTTALRTRTSSSFNAKLIVDTIWDVPSAPRTLTALRLSTGLSFFKRETRESILTPSFRLTSARTTDSWTSSYWSPSLSIKGLTARTSPIFARPRAAYERTWPSSWPRKSRKTSKNTADAISAMTSLMNLISTALLSWTIFRIDSGLSVPIIMNASLTLAEDRSSFAICINGSKDLSSLSRPINKMAESLTFSLGFPASVIIISEAESP